MVILFPNKILIVANKSIFKQSTFSGLQLAGKFLNSDHAKGVAKLVSEAFEKTRDKNNNDEKQSNIFSGFLRVLGFDTKKIGAITVNAIIFVAQLVS